MAHRRLVTAIKDNYLIDDDCRSNHFRIAAKQELSDAGCRISNGRNEYQVNSTQRVTDFGGGFPSRPRNYYKVTYVSPRKQNIIQRMWKRLKRDKLRKLAKKLTNAEETIAIDRRWYHKLIWCKGNKETDPEDLESCIPPDGVSESEHLVIADETLVIVGKQITEEEEEDFERESLKTDSSLSDSSCEDDLYAKCCSPEMESSRLRTPAFTLCPKHEETRLHKQDNVFGLTEFERSLSQQAMGKGFDIESMMNRRVYTTGIGSIAQLPPVEGNPTFYTRFRPLPDIADTNITPTDNNKGPHPWSYKLSSPEAATLIPKPPTSRPLPTLEDSCSKVPLNETRKSSFDSGIDEFADETCDEIERAMSAICARKTPDKKKKREEWLLCQTPNLEKGQSGFSWELDHKLTGPCHRANTPRPELFSTTKRPIKRRTEYEISLGQKLAKEKRDRLIEQRNAKIHQRNDRFQDSHETKELDTEVKKQKLINNQREKEKNHQERLENAKQMKPQKGSTDAKLKMARRRREQQARLEDLGKKSTLGNLQVSSTQAAGFRSNAQKSTKGFVSFQSHEETPVPALAQAKASLTRPKEANKPGPSKGRAIGQIKKPAKHVKKVPSTASVNRLKVSRTVSYERVSSPVHLNEYEGANNHTIGPSNDSLLTRTTSDSVVHAQSPAPKTVPPLLKAAPMKTNFSKAITMQEAVKKVEKARKERAEQERERKEREEEEDKEYWKEFDQDWNDFYCDDDKIETSPTDNSEYEF